jgi:hypothetical protein
MIWDDMDRRQMMPRIVKEAGELAAERVGLVWSHECKS